MGDEVVLVTGAASGIGASAAALLCQRGFGVALIDVDRAGLDEVVSCCPSGRCRAFTADVTDFAAICGAAENAAAHFGRIDAVVANAGVGSWVSLLSMSSEEFQRVIDVNLTGVFHTVRATAPALIERHGYLLIVASVASYVAAPGLAAYCASKAGVEQFANAARMELAPHGVDVGSAHISWVDTPLLRRSRSASPGFGAMLEALPGPLRRTLSAQECATGIADAVDGRRRHLDMPRWVSVARWVKPALTLPAVERALLARTAMMVDGAV